MPTDPHDPHPAVRASDDPLAVFRRDLKTPLTTISGQAQLARRRVRRMNGPEEAYLLARLAAIESAVVVLNQQIERLSGDLFPPKGQDPPGRDEGGA